MIGTDISYAKKLLEEGELVAIPTETVYGLAGNALDIEAIANIFEVKNRPSFDPLILHTNSLDKASHFVKNIPKKAELLAETFWPGALTLVLQKTKEIPALVSSGLDTIGVRVPNHSSTLSLLKQLSFPVAAPSANPFGYISPTSAQHVSDQLGHKIPYILDGGESAIGIESTIVGFENGEPLIYRLGGIALEDIEKIIGKVKVSKSSSANPRSPGMLDSHYSPRKPMYIGDIKNLLKKFKKEDVSILSFNKVYEEIRFKNQFVLSMDSDVHEAAKKLFDGLRQLDKNNTKLILTELLPEHGLGRAINDRLKRASI